MQSDSSSGTASAWLDRLEAGENGASEALTLHLRKFLLRRLLDSGVAHSDAEIVAADCSVDVVSKLGNYDRGQGSLDGWALGFARNRVKQIAKERARTTELREDMVQRSETQVAELTSVVAQLDTEDQNLLRMRFVDKLATNDIAEATGASPAAVRKRLSRLMERLRTDPAIRKALFS
jgi:RNA polymerase sigma factor (sigma-70 family)